jgi:hypothetical protein
MNIFLGILNEGIEGSRFKKLKKLKTPCMPRFLIKSLLWFELFKEQILFVTIEVRRWLISG